MDAPTRRHRSSNRPVTNYRTIEPHRIDQRYIHVLKQLEPYHYFKYLTLPWLHYLTDLGVEYSVFRKYLGYLRQAPNHYLACPEQQNASPNVPYKTLVFELAERGLNELIQRGITPKRYSADATQSRTKRNHSFALHRSNSYYHEIIVDLGYFAPLHHLVRNDPNLRLLDFAQLIAHPNVPFVTRNAADPLLLQLKSGTLRFDGTPHLLIRTSADGVSRSVGIPGIQVDRGTESFRQLEHHLIQAIEFIEDRHYERHWGFENSMIPFLFTKAVRKDRAMQFVRDVRGHFPFLLFQTIPDLGLLHHFPRPEHYDRSYGYAGSEPRHPDNIHIFTNPWQRVGFPDFYLNTFDERGAQ